MTSTAQEKIIQFFEQQEVLQSRQDELLKAEKQKLNDDLVTYTENFILKTDNVLTAQELRAEYDNAEKEAQSIITVTADSRYISEFSNSNYQTALQKLHDVDASRKLLEDAERTVSTQSFNASLNVSTVNNQSTLEV